MLPNDLDVPISGSTRSYTLQSLVEGRSVRRDTSVTNLSLPHTCTIAHSTTGKGDKAMDSYLLRLDSVVPTLVDASSNVQQSLTLSAYLVVKVPRGITNGVTEAYNLAMAIRNVMNEQVGGSTVAVIRRILNGEL